ncbi:MAG: hypothetical protein WCK37_03285 [Candidatus Falkowbacteria bacterium]
MITGEITNRELIHAELILNEKNKCSITVVPSIYFEDKKNGAVEEDRHPRCEVFGGVGPSHIFRIFCLPSIRAKIVLEDLAIAINELPNNEVLYFIIDKNMMDEELKKLLNDDERKFIIVVR